MKKTRSSRRAAAAALVALACSGVAAAGDFQERCDLTRQRVVAGQGPAYTRDFLLADVADLPGRRFTEFSGDTSGRYLEAFSALALQGEKPPRQLADVAEGILSHQSADGHWGKPFSAHGLTTADMAIQWGNGRLLIGLMAYHELTGRDDVLAAARRLGDCMVARAALLDTDEAQRMFSGDQFAVGYICWTTGIEGLVALGRTPGGERYLDLAARMARRVARFPGEHVHGYLTSLRGALELYGVTRDASLLDEVLTQRNALIAAGDVRLDGAVPEAFAPADRRDEGCAEADWLRLNLDLWRVTGQRPYLEQAERTLFNEFCFNQFSTGDFGHHALAEGGMAPPFVEAWWCCTLHGLRTFPAIAAAAFRSDREGLWYDLPVDGRGSSEGLELAADSHLAENGTVEIRAVRSSGRVQTVFLRVPAWASDVTVPGASSRREGAGGTYLGLSRTWRPGERVTVRYAMALRPEAFAASGKKVTFWYGPWLLAVDQSRTPAFFNEPAEGNRLLPGEAPVPVGNRQAHFSFGYSQGGYPSQPQRGTMVPLAEQTETPAPGNWQYAFAWANTAAH